MSDITLSQEQLIEVFGDFTPYLKSDGTVKLAWEELILTRILLPAPLFYAGIPVTKTRCHKKIAEHLGRALNDLYAIPDVWATINDYGGCYNFRLQRKSLDKLSRHCWGIAIDLDVADNPFGRNPRVDKRTVNIFREHGFLWGGNFPLSRRDGMHFEFFDLRKL